MDVKENSYFFAYVAITHVTTERLFLKFYILDVTSEGIAVLKVLYQDSPFVATLMKPIWLKALDLYEEQR